MLFCTPAVSCTELSVVNVVLLPLIPQSCRDNKMPCVNGPNLTCPPRALRPLPLPLNHSKPNPSSLTPLFLGSDAIYAIFQAVALSP